MPSKLSRVNAQKIDSDDAANRRANREEDLTRALRDPFAPPVEDDRGARIQRDTDK